MFLDKLRYTRIWHPLIESGISFDIILLEKSTSLIFFWIAHFWWQSPWQRIMWKTQVNW
jgi:hypothetical protein